MRRLVVRALLLTLTLASFAAATASAGPPAPPGLPTDRPATSPYIAQSLVIADAYWTAHGSPPSKPAKVYMLANGHGANGYADQPGRRIWIADAMLDAARIEDPVERRGLLRWLCVVIVHERGHTLGFAHPGQPGLQTPLPVMDPSRMALPQDAPIECIRWAKRVKWYAW